MKLSVVNVFIIGRPVKRIGSRSLGEVPLAVVRIECQRCARAGSYRLDGLMALFRYDAAQENDAEHTERHFDERGDKIERKGIRGEAFGPGNKRSRGRLLSRRMRRRSGGVLGLPRRGSEPEGNSTLNRSMRIPRQSGQGFRFDVGRRSDLIPATIPK
jgi:hypothetical protein